MSTYAERSRREGSLAHHQRAPGVWPSLFVGGGSLSIPTQDELLKAVGCPGPLPAECAPLGWVFIASDPSHQMFISVRSTYALSHTPQT